MNDLFLNDKDLIDLIESMEKENREENEKERKEEVKKTKSTRIRNRKTIYLKDETLEILEEFMKTNNCNLSSIIQDCIESIILGEEDVKIEKREIVKSYNLKIESFQNDFKTNSLIRDLKSNTDYTNKLLIKKLRENQTEELKEIYKQQKEILESIDLILKQQEEILNKKKQGKKELLKLLKEEVEKGNLKVSYNKKGD